MGKAVETYQRAIKVDARCALAHNDLGLCYARQNDLARARESLSKAVSLVPTSKLYRNNLATVLVDARQYNEAYEQLAAVHPPATAQYNLGVLANRRGDKVEAMNRMQQALALEPNLAQARTMIDRLNGVPQSAPALPNLAEQGRQMQAGVQNEARQLQAGMQQQGRQYQEQWRDTARQAKTQVGQIQTRFADHVQSGVQNAENQAANGMNQTSEAAQAKIREAEAKIRAAVQSQVAPIGPAYTNSWVPAQADDITPIQPPPNFASPAQPEADDYSAGSEGSPVLLPPTGE
jgi:Tfp pilus assembly protein PilF